MKRAFPKRNVGLCEAWPKYLLRGQEVVRLLKIVVPYENNHLTIFRQKSPLI